MQVAEDDLAFVALEPLEFSVEFRHGPALRADDLKHLLGSGFGGVLAHLLVAVDDQVAGQVVADRTAHSMFSIVIWLGGTWPREQAWIMASLAVFSPVPLQTAARKSVSFSRLSFDAVNVVAIALGGFRRVWDGVRLRVQLIEVAGVLRRAEVEPLLDGGDQFWAAVRVVAAWLNLT